MNLSSDPDRSLQHLFSQPRFELFLESLVENPLYRDRFRRTVDILLLHDPLDFKPSDWLAWVDGLPRLNLPDLDEKEKLVLYRWLLDKIFRIYGQDQKRRGRNAGLELLNELLDRLSKTLTHRVIGDILENLLPLAQEPALASDVYHWLFLGSFQPTPQIEPLFYAIQGLEWAKKSKDRERIAWSFYNLAHYYTYFDGDEAEAFLDESIDYMRDERYFDILGHIALKNIDQGKNDRAQVYLESVFLFLKRTVMRDELFEIATEAMNLVYFTLSLSWIYSELEEWNKVQETSDYLWALLIKNRMHFLSDAADMGIEVTDGRFQVHSYTAEAYLWAYIARVKQGQEAEARSLGKSLETLVRTCPYDLKPLLEDFTDETGITLPWIS